uniref:Het-C-domain-containing protein n=1 Tax=Bionectria ochroleuca TaxID=29856 RepID=A0A8H7N7V6_BIOOC
MLRLALFLSLVWWAAPAAAFGAGNIASISKVEGKNWRHGDIEDVLLSLAAAHAYNRGKKFSKLMIKQTYLGNWCRDYSQAIDVGTVKAVSAEAIRLLLCVLGFMTFGYGSGEFEITAERLGCYRPEEHIDNPKGYGEGVDARDYDRRLRGPIDEETELAVDEETGMKNYIANERIGIMTSADLLRRLIGGCVEKGRRYKDNNNKRDLHESLRLLGTALHCLEDFYAHSNYVELALIELGERDVFPHVGSSTQIRLQGARGQVYPIVTGTFGGVDFLHSVTGEVSDKLTQNEIDELEGTLQESAKSDTSLLKDLLDKIPDGIFGDKHESDKLEQLQENANNAQMENMNVSPREPEEFTRYIQQVYGQVLPVIEFHDEIMKGITAAIEKIPVLPKIIEQLEEELSRFVFSLIAPFVVPLIQNIKNELATGSNQIIESSEAEQHVVFDNDDSSDPTHSMLSKDHFTNILNEIAGQSAAKMITWVVPQIMEAIDDDSVDVNRLVTRIVNGVMHHPAQREMGDDGAQEGRQQIFQAVQEWWSEMGEDQRQDYRRKLSRRGVQNGENHKEGVYDTGHGHGCSGKLKMQKLYGEPETMEDKIASAAAGALISGAAEALGGGNGGGKNTSGGDLGGFLGVLGSALGVGGGDDGETKKKKNRRDDDEDDNQGSSYQQSSYGGHNTSSYGQGASESYSQGFSSNSRQESRYGGGGGEADSYSQGFGSSQQSYGHTEERRHESGGYGGEQRQAAATEVATVALMSAVTKVVTEVDMAAPRSAIPNAVRRAATVVVRPIHTARALGLPSKATVTPRSAATRVVAMVASSARVVTEAVTVALMSAATRVATEVVTAARASTADAIPTIRMRRRSIDDASQMTLTKKNSSATVGMILMTLIRKSIMDAAADLMMMMMMIMNAAEATVAPLAVMAEEVTGRKEATAVMVAMEAAVVTEAMIATVEAIVTTDDMGLLSSCS